MMRMKAVESRQSYQYRPACPSLLMTRQSTTGISHKICHLVCWTFHWTQSNTFSRGAPREILPDSVSSPMSPGTSLRNVECRTYPSNCSNIIAFLTLHSVYIDAVRSIGWRDDRNCFHIRHITSLEKESVTKELSQGNLHRMAYQSNNVERYLLIPQTDPNFEWYLHSISGAQSLCRSQD